MKLFTIFFIYLAYGTFGALYNGSEADENLFPTFNAPDVEFQDLPPACDGVYDCIQYVGQVIINLVLGVVYVVLLIIAVLVYLVLFLAVVAENAFTGFDGAPEWLSAIVVGLFAAAFGLGVYRALRKGDTEA